MIYGPEYEPRVRVCASCASRATKYTNIGYCDRCKEPCCDQCAAEIPGEKLLCVPCEEAMREEPDPPCECIRTDVDIYDASGCPAHGRPVQRGGL